MLSVQDFGQVQLTQMLLVSGGGAVDHGNLGSAVDAVQCLHGVVRDVLFHGGHGLSQSRKESTNEQQQQQMQV